ncbi:MAG: alpha/beta hydrolase [Cytobacillus gottheilii]
MQNIMLGSENTVKNKRFPFRLIEQKGQTTNLVIVLPGAGYTTQAPLLHFTTGIFYSKGFDVLHINYGFSREEMAELNAEDFTRNVYHSIEDAIKDKNYSHFYIVAKSIGTIALSGLLHNPVFHHAKAVWLTPLLQRDDVFNSMVNSEQEGLCIIGDCDPCFIEERFELLRKNNNLTLSLIGDGNHALEIEGQPLKSIDILKNVMAEIDRFSEL